MERGWSRHAPLIPISPADAETYVRTAFPGARVLAAEPLSGGLRNTNVRLLLDGGPSPLVLRIYTADRDACCREGAVLASLDGLVPVPAVYTADGTADPPFALLGWIDGTPLDQVLDEATDPQALRLAAACGRALAAIHSIRFPEAGFLGPALRVVAPLPGWAETIRELVAGSAGRALGASLAGELLRTVDAHAAEMAALGERPVLCHADYKPWNLLAAASDATRLAGVVDWEFAIAATPLLDVAIFLRDEGRRPVGYADAFAAGYASAGGELPEEWRRLSHLLDLINLCQLIERGGVAAARDLVPLVEATIRES